MSEQSYYDVLGISRDAGATEIRRAYKRKAQRYHPDKRENKAFADHKFKQIQEAYRVLSSPTARAEYNARHAFNESVDATDGAADSETHTASSDARYYIYENWQAGPHKAVIHHAECGHCNHGTGRSGRGTNPRYGKWHGGFESLDETVAYRETMGVAVKKECACIYRLAR